VIEPDPIRAAQMFGDRLMVLTGENDSRLTYERARAAAARLVLANCEDTTNTNITLTVREVAPQVAIVAIVEDEDAIDILQLSGASSVLALKHQLGAYLASRIETGRLEAHVVGEFRRLQIAELPARDTPFVGKIVRDTKLRQQAGVSIVGFWERGRLRPAYPETMIQPDTVLVVAGTASQIGALNMLLPDGGDTSQPVLVIGAGKVGQAAVGTLKRKALKVHVIDRSESALAPVAAVVDGMFAGDAADGDLLRRAGIMQARSVLLTTNDDAMNIYLAVYCRRLNKDLRIISRITHERNLEAIHRAGADFVLSYTTLGIEGVLSLLRGHPPLVLGEGVELFFVRVPASLAGRPLKESAIGSHSGLSVVAVQEGDVLTAPLTGETILPAGADLVVLGSNEQRARFEEEFGRG